MAKALLGFVGAPSDQRLAAEVARLRGRVRELEAELSVVRAELTTLRDHDAEVAQLRVPDEDMVRLADLEHATV